MKFSDYKQTDEFLTLLNEIENQLDNLKLEISQLDEGMLQTAGKYAFKTYDKAIDIIGAAKSNINKLKNMRNKVKPENVRQASKEAQGTVKTFARTKVGPLGTKNIFDKKGKPIK
jgi:hypothetical protein